MTIKSEGHFGGKVQRVREGGTRMTSSTAKEVGMAGSSRPAGMDNIPSTFNVGKKADKGKTDLGKVASIAHVNRPDRGVKGAGGDKGGGKR